MTTAATLKSIFCFAAVLATLLQVLIEPTSVNILCCILVLLSTGTLMLYLVWTDALQTHPLSTYSIIGFCITTQLGALLVQTAAWTPLDFELYDPLRTFGLLAFFQLVALCTHALFRALYTPDRDAKSPLKMGIARLGIYEIPSSPALWIVGLIGLASFSLANAQGVGAKLADGFNFLAWAPFLIPTFTMSHGPKYANMRRTLLLLLGYAAMIAAVAVLTNVRSTLFLGFVTVSLMILFSGLRSTNLPRPGTVFKLTAASFVLYLALQPLSDFVIAMGVVRESPGKHAPMELLTETFYVLSKPALIDRYRSREAMNTLSSYDEFYIKSPMMAKIVETKFHDNALHFAKSLTSEQDKSAMWDVTIDTCLSGLPAPLLRFLRIDVDKSLNTYSMGDFLVHLSVGRPLGGMKTGSQFAQGLVLFGVFYPLVYGGICFLTFYACWLLTSPVAMGSASIAAVAMIRIWLFFQHGISQDGLAQMFIMLFRGVIEMIFVYFVALQCAKFFLKDRYVFRWLAPGST